MHSAAFSECRARPFTGAHAVDLALRYCQETTDVSQFEQVSNRPFYPYAAPGLIPFDGDCVKPEDLTQHWLIGDYIPELWPAWLREAGLNPVPRLKLTTPMQTLLTIEYAVARQGVLLISSDLVAAEVREGKLERLSDVGLQSGGYYLVTNEVAARRKTVRALKAWILEQSEGLRG